MAVLSFFPRLRNYQDSVGSDFDEKKCCLYLIIYKCVKSICLERIMAVLSLFSTPTHF